MKLDHPLTSKWNLDKDLNVKNETKSTRKKLDEYKCESYQDYKEQASFVFSIVLIFLYINSKFLK